MEYVPTFVGFAVEYVYVAEEIASLPAREPEVTENEFVGDTAEPVQLTDWFAAVIVIGRVAKTTFVASEVADE
jgi:hypothetical protein